MEICKPTNLTINNYPNILEVYYRTDCNEYLLLDRSIQLETPWIRKAFQNIDLTGAFIDDIERSPNDDDGWFQYYSYLGNKYSSLDQLAIKHPEALI